MLAQDIMSHPVVTVGPRTRIEEVVTTLGQRRLSAVAVVDDAGHPLGIVSVSDLLFRVAHVNLPPHVEILGSTIYLDTPKHMEERLQKLGAVFAEDLMSKPPVSVQATDAVESVADVLMSRKVHRVLVLSDGRLAGIITRGDVVRQSLAAQWKKNFSDSGT
ncbi:MAG TPA: CBS domain-containing protein, partial [Candidatus Xenobia bacterium]